MTDDAVLYDVFDKNFQKITIDYLDYLNSKVVASEFVDYENNVLKPTEEGKIEVKHRMKRKIVDKDDFDLIDLHPDYRLSETTRQIPFTNFTDSVRISMGTSENIHTLVYFVNCWNIEIDKSAGRYYFNDYRQEEKDIVYVYCENFKLFDVKAGHSSNKFSASFSRNW